MKDNAMKDKALTEDNQHHHEFILDRSSYHVDTEAGSSCYVTEDQMITLLRIVQPFIFAEKTKQPQTWNSEQFILPKKCPRVKVKLEEYNLNIRCVVICKTYKKKEVYHNAKGAEVYSDVVCESTLDLIGYIHQKKHVEGKQVTNTEIISRFDAALKEVAGSAHNQELNGIPFVICTNQKRDTGRVTDKGKPIYEKGRSALQFSVTRVSGKGKGKYRLDFLSWPHNHIMGDNSYPVSTSSGYLDKQQQLLNFPLILLGRLVQGMGELKLTLRSIQLAVYSNEFESKEQRDRCCGQLNACFSSSLHQGDKHPIKRTLRKKGIVLLPPLKNNSGSYGGFGLQTRVPFHCDLGYPDLDVKQTNNAIKFSTCAFQFKDLENSLRGKTHVGSKQESLERTVRLDITLFSCGLWDFIKYLCSKRLPSGEKNKTGKINRHDAVRLRKCLKFVYPKNSDQPSSVKINIPIEFWLAVLGRFRHPYVVSHYLKVWTFGYLHLKPLFFTNTFRSIRFRDLKTFLESRGRKVGMGEEQQAQLWDTFCKRMATFKHEKTVDLLKELFQGCGVADRTLYRWEKHIREDLDYDLTIPLSHFKDKMVGLLWMEHHHDALNELMREAYKINYDEEANADYAAISTKEAYNKLIEKDFKNLSHALFSVNRPGTVRGHHNHIDKGHGMVKATIPESSEV